MSTSTSESSNCEWYNSNFIFNPPASCSSAEPAQMVFLSKVGPENPYIEILEQPQTHTRFRYGSEGDHGYLYGEQSTRKHPSYPTVQLVNYRGDTVRIRCDLYQTDKEEEHPHQLNGDKNQLAYLEPVNGNHIVSFKKLSFINKSINRFSKELCAQYMKANPGAKEKEVNKYCRKVVKAIDFNKVRLRFSAHDVQTDEEICHVYSRPILNSKNPESNQLQIVRVSKNFGWALGCEEITLLVEKISNANTKVRFVEAEGGWSEIAHPIYKHHQLAIVCSIPPYKDPKIAHDVTVYIELFRETDGATSNRIQFTYTGRRHLAKRDRKRAITLSASHAISVGDSSKVEDVMESPIKIKKSDQVCEVPISPHRWSIDLQIPKEETPGQPIPHVLPKTEQNDKKADSTGQNSDTDSGIQENGGEVPMSIEEDIISLLEESEFESSMQSLVKCALSPEEIRLTESLLEDNDDSILRSDPVLSEAASVPRIAARPRPRVAQTNEIEIFNEHYRKLDQPEYFGMDIIDDMTQFQELVPDCAKRREYKDSKIQKHQFQPNPIPIILKIKKSTEMSKTHHTIGKMMEMEQIKELVQDPNSDLKTKLVNLFELELPNGNTLLHVVINRPIFSTLVQTLHAVNMTYVLNKPNDLDQTVLHLAVLNEAVDAVQMLVSEGCDPMLMDVDGNNAIHLAVTSFATLAALLGAMAVNKVPYNVNATNYEKRTALHVASIYGCEPSARLLLKHGADVGARDSWGRTALHLAACHDRAPTLSVLLDHMDAGDVDVDATDSRGRTALQTACDSDVRENTLAVIQLLLEAKADPTKCERNTMSAMKLAGRHQEMRQTILRHRHNARLDDSEDEYHTADEGDSEECIASNLQGLIVNEVKCY